MVPIHQFRGTDPYAGPGRRRGESGSMSGRADQVKRRRAAQAEPIPEIRPWCEAGWIFCNGDARAIERRDDHTDVRSAPVHDEPDD